MWQCYVQSSLGYCSSFKKTWSLFVSLCLCLSPSHALFLFIFKILWLCCQITNGQFTNKVLLHTYSQLMSCMKYFWKPQSKDEGVYQFSKIGCTVGFYWSFHDAKRSYGGNSRIQFIVWWQVGFLQVFNYIGMCLMCVWHHMALPLCPIFLHSKIINSYF